MHFTKSHAIFVIFLIFSLSSMSVTAASVGVQPGNWAKYTVSAMGYDYSAIKISISSVSGTTVSGTITYEFSQGSPQTSPFEGDVSTGETFPYIIPANLGEGDEIYYGSPEIGGVTTKSYAGASRTVVYIASYGYTYYWDQQTGIIVEMTFGPGSIKLTETNIWGGGIFDIGSPLFWILIVVIIVVVVVILLAVVLPFLRKKAPPKETVTPPSPPEEKIVKTKYCPKCGATMPLDATYCPKCAHKQPQ